MAESSVKNCRCDYVYLACRDSGEVVLQQLPRWFDDYDSVHPH